VWYHNGKWRVSTNGTIDAYKCPLGLVDFAQLDCPYETFGELFDVAKEKAKLDFNSLDIYCTYMFELVSPYNKVVVNYEDIEIYHIGTRNNVTYDEIEIVTRPRGVKGPSFIRDYDILKNGERVAYASSYWVLIDFEKRKFCRPSAISAVCEIVPDMDNLYEMEMRKLHPDINEMVKSDERKVYYSSIDRNNHMNNTFYPDILFDYLPESYLDTLSGKTITVQYNSEILCGEHFSVYTKEENGEFTLSARCEKENRDIFSAMITM
jgi:acyl-CoA thioesterase FadM